ncbi:hypothetical protein BD410DRAFT_91659 [Rickenella mellea]|uniref:Uncharacterized protein n=1 Tax=Rickenella mellea TaxID=50990 RepID=A0A4Y7QB53_9AGAM|nr:hypothetical protein BD410DRAFT_91659 [Rickenella mellea]
MTTDLFVLSSTRKSYPRANVALTPWPDPSARGRFRLKLPTLEVDALLQGHKASLLLIFNLFLDERLHGRKHIPRLLADLIARWSPSSAGGGRRKVTAATVTSASTPPAMCVRSVFIGECQFTSVDVTGMINGKQALLHWSALPRGSEQHEDRKYLPKEPKRTSHFLL